MGITTACFNLEGKDPLSTEMFGILRPLVIFQDCLNFTYNNFEILLVVFMPNITTNHAITCTNFRESNTEALVTSKRLKSLSRMTEQTQFFSAARNAFLGI